ncbi:MAG: glycosyltransferase family 9 protein [Elusimicrobia bacterium]|nr:glycosyltransferase family 9 protein [Elusimicrobiota bacterium]
MEPLALNDARRIALLWIGRLGDFLVATPFLRALRRRFPGAEVTVIVGERGREAAALCPEVDEIRVLGKLHAPLANLHLAATLAAGCYDLLVDLNTAFSRSSAAVAWLTQARVKLGFRKAAGNRLFTHLVQAPETAEHMLDRYGRLAAAIDAPYEPLMSVRVPEPEGARGRAAVREALARAAPGARPVLIHPGNFQKFENRWPEDRFAALTDRLLDDPAAAPVYLCGPGEEAQARAIVARLKRPVPMLAPMSLAALAGALTEAELLIVNATGTAHLAAALGVPTLTFLGGYTKAVWMPRAGPHYSVVSASWESCRDISVDAAWEALGSALKELRAAKSAR